MKYVGIISFSLDPLKSYFIISVYGDKRFHDDVSEKLLGERWEVNTWEPNRAFAFLPSDR